MEKLKKPKQLETIVYFSKEDDCFIAHSVECDQMGEGETKEEAIDSLGITLSLTYEDSKKHSDIAFYSKSPKSIQQALEKAKSNPNKYPPIIHEVPNYFKTNCYDFTKEEIVVD